MFDAEGVTGTADDVQMAVGCDEQRMQFGGVARRCNDVVLAGDDTRRRSAAGERCVESSIVVVSLEVVEILDADRERLTCFGMGARWCCAERAPLDQLTLGPASEATRRRPHRKAIELRAHQRQKQRPARVPESCKAGATTANNLGGFGERSEIVGNSRTRETLARKSVRTVAARRQSDDECRDAAFDQRSRNDRKKSPPMPCAKTVHDECSTTARIASRVMLHTEPRATDAVPIEDRFHGQSATMRSAMVRACCSPANSVTIASANSTAVPAPRLVTMRPDCTTRSVR